MSCTENESGPFVVFFLPAVVGCLTILLARRWANSQVSNTSSTAVSRRRKIIKDPLAKRTLPPIACKMLSAGSKKASGFPKKGAFNVTEDDVNGGGKRVGRPARLSPTSTPASIVSDVKLPEGPMPPKHIPFPFIPQDGELLFEAMTFMFTLVATGLQFLNLYRTGWWLPHSHTHQAMHFHLIDPHLVAFIVTLLLRRLLLSLTLTLLRSILAPKLMPHATIAARMFILGVVLGALAWCTYFIFLKYPLIKTFYLCYPAVVYFLLFGFQCVPFLELSNCESPPLHCCSHDPQQIRAEVDVLREDFNLRVKKILFNAVIGAYYSSFIPCCFVQSFVYYEVYAASQQVVFVCGGLLGRYASQLLAAPLCDVPHRAARHLGRWRLAPHTPHSPHHPRNAESAGEVSAASGASAESAAGAASGPSAWSGARLWRRGARAVVAGACGAGGAVGEAGAVYVADAPAVAAEPGCAAHARFYAVFINPSTLLCVLLCLQLSLIVLQLCLLFSSISWHYFLSIVILLFMNYYTLFKMMRDYLVAWKVYKAENMIQEKNSPTQSLIN